MKVVTKIAALLVCLAAVIDTGHAQNWLQLTPASGNAPAPRSNAAAIYDSLNHRLVIFGGKSASGNLNDVWAFDLRTNTWSELTPTSGPAPALRFTANGVYNPAVQQMIIWSGQGSGFFNDVWAFDLNAESWSQFTPPDPKPNTRYGVASIFDPKAKEMVAFAGFTDAGRFDDTWRFNIANATWKEISLTTHPERRCLHSASYDALEHRMIIYGGQTSGPRGDIWAFDLTNNTWADLTPQTSPAGRWFSTNIYDAVNNRAIIFGGGFGGGSVTNEVWGFDLAQNSWQQISASGTPPSAREGAVAIYTRAEGRMVVFGGLGNAYFNDIWVLNLSSTTGVDSNSDNEFPITFRLLGNYPNPFNPATMIVFEMPAPANISLRVYNLQGQQVKNLFEGKIDGGRHQMVWDGTNDLGAKVISGIYFYVLKAGAISVSRKMTLVE
ncbi:T9SS type A sorting domain-containing protein [candidate division KSB1 bacterium]|nr:T9SS type A sorting domain-containing protein [candidate division KSB1 bacterium]